MFGGILGRRDNATDLEEMKQYNIPELDLVIVDLYPFEETVATTSEEKAIIEKIDIGGPSMIRGAAKNFRDVVVLAAKSEYVGLEQLLREQKGLQLSGNENNMRLKLLKQWLIMMLPIAHYFNPGGASYFFESIPGPKTMRYGENPHQSGKFFGQLENLFTQLNGKRSHIIIW